jgi:predicted RNA methylase
LKKLKVKVKVKELSLYGHDPAKLDQYLTKPNVAAQCIDKVIQLLKNHDICASFDLIIEPSCGTGAFVDLLLPLVGAPQLVYMDIDSRSPQHNHDYLDYQLTTQKGKTYLTIGNPPFGQNSSLAMSFIKKAATYSDMIAFILPRTFCKDTLLNRIPRQFFLVHQHDLDCDSFTFNGTDWHSQVSFVFQMWSKNTFIPQIITTTLAEPLRPLIPKINQTTDFYFIRVPDEADIVVRRVGVTSGEVYDQPPEGFYKSNYHYLKLKNPARRERVIAGLKASQLQSKFNAASMPSITQTELCLAYNRTHI